MWFTKGYFRSQAETSPSQEDNKSHGRRDTMFTVYTFTEKYRKARKRDCE